MDYSTLSDEALTAGLKACAEMVAKPSSKELFEWALAQHMDLKAEKARRVSARSPAAIKVKAQEEAERLAQQALREERARKAGTEQVRCLYRVGCTCPDCR